MLNYHIVVTGRVQGVGFRWSTHELALQYGLVGQVKNEWDGSVTIGPRSSQSSQDVCQRSSGWSQPICQSCRHANRATRH